MQPSPAAAKPDVIVIGTGQAGVPLATRLAAAGKRVVIVERGKPGGTCVTNGCTPTKTLIASARAAHVARTSERLGVRVGGVTVDFAAVMARKDAIVRRWRSSVERRLQEAGDRLRFVRGHASFVAPRTVEVDGERLLADHVVINSERGPPSPTSRGSRASPRSTARASSNCPSSPRSSCSWAPATSRARWPSCFGASARR